jgi:hypothetical protein
MKTWVKVLIGFFIFSIFIGVLRNIFPAESKTNSVKKEIIKPFDSLSIEEKKSLVNDFIHGNDSTKTRPVINQIIKTYLKQSVKYPETLEYLYNNEWVDGTETYVYNPSDCKVDSEIPNRIYVYVDFRSENNFSQKVRNKFELIFDFKGHEPYKLVDGKILN